MNTESYIPEKELNDHPKSIGLEQMDIIKEKMEKSICKITCPRGGFGTGFFCKLPFPNELNLLPVLITNFHVLDKKDIMLGNNLKFSLKNDELIFQIYFDNERKTYANEEYDITILELKQKDRLYGYSLLEIDDKVFMDIPKNYYKNKTIYLIHYPHGHKVEFSTGIIKNIFENNYTISHLCSTEKGSSGGPLINILTHKVIGLHKGGKEDKNFNLGTLLNIPIQEFNQKYNNNHNMNNQFQMNNINFINNINNQNNINKNIQNMIFNNKHIHLNFNNNKNINSKNNNICFMNFNNQNKNLNNNNMNMPFNLMNNQNFMNNNNLNLQNINIIGMNKFIPYNNNSNINVNSINIDKENESIKSLLFTSSYKRYFPLKGLSNVGLTYYMNSTLQCLLHIPELNDYFINKYLKESEKLNKINKKAETKGKLSKEYYLVVKGVCEDIINPKSFNYSSSFSPKSFNNTLSRLNTQFAQFEANDSKDLLLYLFQTIHEELNYLGEEKLNRIPKCNQSNEQESFNFFKKVNCNLNLSIISYLFYGILKSTTTCSRCKSLLYNFQYFQFLSFPTYTYKGKKMNIYQGFKDFVKEEEMKGDNQFYCQNCKGLREAKVNSSIFYTPPYPIINFDYGKDKKFNPSEVDFGEVIELKGFTEDICTQNDYELIGVSSHIGKSGISGHYIAYCKDINKQEWHKFNDSIHSKCDFNEVNSNSPYILVYKRKDN